jgi:hypothetical protein
MVEIVKLSAKDAIHYWSAFEELLQKGIDRSQGEWSLEHYRDYVEHEYVSIWVALVDEEIKSIAVSEVLEHPNFNELLIRLIAGGDSSKWMTSEWQEKTFKKYAKEQDCKKIRMYGRVGWLKRLAPLGWKHDYTVMSLDV